ncbi:glycosyltransferase family 1 protein [Opitutaceae bacterium EW11]|nr:glycosyltransferase family 1 protein [Opitutaceae bacterium EW11]
MLLIDLSHTSHTTAQTGIQRVCRALLAELSRTQPVEPITFDPFERGWRALRGWERANLSSTIPVHTRGARWPMRARLAGKARRFLKRTPVPHGDGLLVPEVFSAAVAAGFRPLLASIGGPRVALFHDAIALKYPELTPQKTVARFPHYLQELLAFDGVAAVSEDSRASLVDYWKWLGVASSPPVVAVPLPLGRDVPEKRDYREVTAAASKPEEPPPVVLVVGSIEGRKNHLALLEACERVWKLGARFQLRIVGLAHPQTGRAALERIRQLQSAGYALKNDGPVDDATLDSAYRDCAFTVYPSIVEGFGLPVLESLAHGKPCICSARGALGESARGGGCLALGSVDASALAAGIQKLLNDVPFRQELERQACRRTFRSWAQFAADLTTWMRALPRRG